MNFHFQIDWVSNGECLIRNIHISNIKGQMQYNALPLLNEKVLLFFVPNGSSSLNWPN
jgi:hypothetical protein